MNNYIEQIDRWFDSTNLKFFSYTSIFKITNFIGLMSLSSQTFQHTMVETCNK